MAILEINLNNEKVQVEEDVWESFVDNYIKHFSQKSSWYRIGISSGKVIYEGRRYGEVFDFFEELRYKDLLSSFQFLRTDERKAWTKNDLMIAIDETIRDMYKEEMDTYLFFNESANQLYTFRKEPTQTPYSLDGQDVVFWVYNEMASGTNLYAVPKDLAKRLHLLDYQREEIRRDEAFLSELEPFKLDHGYMYNGE